MTRDAFLRMETTGLYTIAGIRDQSADGDYINDATVTFTLYNAKKGADGAETVTGAVNLSATYVTGSDGDYELIIPHTLTLTREAIYYGYVKAVKDSTQWLIELELEADYL